MNIIEAADAINEQARNIQAAVETDPALHVKQALLRAAGRDDGEAVLKLTEALRILKEMGYR